MKFHRFLLLFLFLTAVGFAQDLTKKITINVQNEPISLVLKQIQAQAGINFSYSPEAIPAGKLITVKAINKPLREVLDQVLLKNGVEYQFVESQFVLKRITGRELAEKPVTGHNSVRYTVSGFLYDQSTHESLIGANVIIRGTSTGAVTNGYGFFSLTLKPGNYTLVFSYLGYKTEERAIVLDQHIRMSVEMGDEKVMIGEVEILSGSNEQDGYINQVSGLSLSRKSLAKLPGFGGNIDVIRALQVIPGIQSFGDGSSLYFVRGGNSDQNLLLIDDVPVYNPSHLFGFFSAFSPDAINNVQVFKGDFPAKYGGRLSSVIDIKAREGNMKQFGTSGNIGPFASNLTLEGPIVKNKSSFILSGRLSTLNWLNNLKYFNNSFGFQFFDFNAKVNLIPNNTNRFFLTFYYGLDDFSRYNSVEINSYGISWNNLAATGRWYHVFNNRLFANSTFSYSQYRYSLNLPQETNGYWQSSISNLTGKTDLTWYLNPQNTLRGGLQLSGHRSDPGNVTIENGNTPGDIPEVSKYHSLEFVVYLSNEQRFGAKWSMRYGLRLPVWQDWGATKVYYFDAGHKVIDTITFGAAESYSTTFSPEPRISLQYLITPELALRAGYSRNTQFLQLLSNSTSPFNSLEVWAPCGPNIMPQIADQVVAGITTNVAGKMATLSVEGYYKWYSNRLDYKDHPNLLFNTLIEGELRFGRGESYGIETMIRKNSGKFTGWIGYTWSRALIQTSGINRDQLYPSTYDRPHSFCVNLSFDDQKRWRLAANWIFLSGGAVTLPVGFYRYNGYSVPIYGDRNNQRLPDYHRLDLMAAYTFNKPDNRFKHSLSVTIYNAYGRFNPFSLNFNKLENDQGQFVVPSNLYAGNVLVPTWFSVAGIIPSVNYNFKF